MKLYISNERWNSLKDTVCIKIINNYSKYFLENLKHLANNYTFKFTYLLVLNYSRWFHVNSLKFFVICCKKLHSTEKHWFNLIKKKKKEKSFFFYLAGRIHQRAHRGVRKCDKISATIDRTIGSQHTMGGSQSRYNSRLVEEIYRVAIKTRRI